MSFGLGHGRDLDDAPGVIGITDAELPPLPDDILTNPAAGHVDPRRWFRDPSRPFELEIGSGKGTFLLAQAQSDPGTNYLGIEWAREFYLYAADRLRRAGLANARMLHADATDFLRWRVPSSIVRVIHLYFSDPWPKPRHHKNRVVRDAVLAQAWRVLAPGGELRIVTDHDDYWAWMEEHFSRWTLPNSAQLLPPAFRPADASAPAFRRGPFVPPPFVGEGEVVGTNFERKYRREGRTFHATTLTRVP